MLFRFSTTKMQWGQLDAPQASGSPPGARSGHGMVAVGSDLYVFGGSKILGSYYFNFGGPTNEFFRFSTTERKWEEIQVNSTKPNARSGLGMAAVGSDLYVFGGGGESTSNELFRFSTINMQWKQPDAPPVSGTPPSVRS